MPNFSGLGSDTPTVTNERGAKQSDSPYRLDLFPPEVMFNVGQILDRGAKKYGDDNWRGLSVETNINHALAHLYAYLGGDKQDNHLGNAVCRTMFALAISLVEPVPSTCSYCTSSDQHHKTYTSVSGDKTATVCLNCGYLVK